MIGVEPEAGDDTRRSLEAGERVRDRRSRARSPTASSCRSPGELTFPVVQRYVERVVTVTDEEIVAAMRFLFERAKTVAEPSGACAFAALLAGRVGRRRRAGRGDDLGRQRDRRALRGVGRA